MPVIVTCSTKGGVGKSTTALVLAQVLNKAGSRVTLIDADPNQPIARWAKRTETLPDGLVVRANVNELTILDEIDNASAEYPFVIVDLEGSANMTTSFAISRADLILVPMKGKQLDADEAAKVIAVIERDEKAYKVKLDYRIMFSMTGALYSKEMKHIETSLRERGIPMLDAAMAERAAFSAIFQIGGTIYDLTKKDVTNPDAAIKNAELVAHSIVTELKKQGKGAKAA